MLDLKNQLLKAGLVTEEQVEKVEQAEQAEQAAKRARRAAKGKGGKGGKGKGPRGKGGKARGGRSDAQLWRERIAKLKAGGKAEQYDAVRNWVKRHRLDPDGGLPSEQAERFHFEKDDGGISWLTIEPDLKAMVSKGEAGIIAYMSNHGLTHCVVPRKVAEDIGELRPEWVRHLKGFIAVARSPAPAAPASRAAPVEEGEPAQAAEGAPAEGEPAEVEPAEVEPAVPSLPEE